MNTFFRFVGALVLVLGIAYVGTQVLPTVLPKVGNPLQVVVRTIGSPDDTRKEPTTRPTPPETPPQSAPTRELERTVKNTPPTPKVTPSVSLLNIPTTPEVPLSTPLVRAEGPVSTGVLNEKEIIRLTNVARLENGGHAPLSWNVKLEGMALKKAQDMLARQYFAHESPSGINVSGLAKEAGYDYRTIGENLAEGDFVSNTELLDGWMNSPGHRANILNEEFTQMGAAAVEGNYQGRMVWMAVQEFGRPSPVCTKPDPYLHDRITIYEGQVSQLEGTLSGIDAQLATPNDTGEYTQNVKDFNTIVALHNKLVAELKIFIADYNAQVATYNVCIKG